MYEIYSKGATPYEGIDNRDLRQHLQEGNRLERPDNMPQHVYVLILCHLVILNFSPASRGHIKHVDMPLATLSKGCPSDF